MFHFHSLPLIFNSSCHFFVFFLLLFLDFFPLLIHSQIPSDDVIISLRCLNCRTNKVYCGYGHDRLIYCGSATRDNEWVAYCCFEEFYHCIENSEAYTLNQIQLSSMNNNNYFTSLNTTTTNSVITLSSSSPDSSLGVVHPYKCSAGSSTDLSTGGQFLFIFIYFLLAPLFSVVCCVICCLLLRIYRVSAKKKKEEEKMAKLLREMEKGKRRKEKSIQTVSSSRNRRTKEQIGKEKKIPRKSSSTEREKEEEEKATVTVEIPPVHHSLSNRHVDIVTDDYHRLEDEPNENEEQKQ